MVSLNLFEKGREPFPGSEQTHLGAVLILLRTLTGTGSDSLVERTVTGGVASKARAE